MITTDNFQPPFDMNSAFKNKRVIAKDSWISNRQDKHCPDCDEVKSIDCFYKNKSERDKHASVCKLCSYERHRDWYKRNPFHTAKYRQEYFLVSLHKEAHNSSSRKNSQKPDVNIRRKKYAADYYLKNKDKDL